MAAPPGASEQDHGERKPRFSVLNDLCVKMGCVRELPAMANVVWWASAALGSLGQPTQQITSGAIRKVSPHLEKGFRNFRSPDRLCPERAIAGGCWTCMCVGVRRKLSKLSPGRNVSATGIGFSNPSPDPLRGPHLPQISPCPGSPLISFGGTGHHELRGVGQLAPRRDRPCQKFAFRPGPKENSQCVREMPATETQGTHRDCLYQRRPFLGSC